MVYNVQGEVKGGAEGGGEAVVGWGVEAEEVDALSGLSAGYTSTGGDGKSKERWNRWHFYVDSVGRRMARGSDSGVEKVDNYGACLRSYL